MTITRQDDGTLTLAAESECKVKVLLITAYSYSYHAYETWKGGRLQRFESHGKENSKPFAISAQAEGDKLRLKINGQESSCRGDVWMTSIWQLPPAKSQCAAAPGTAVAVPLLGCDNGLEVSGQLQYVGAEQITVAGQEMTCAHYRVMKPVPHDVWYDGSERMVRDVWMSDGHRSEIVLTGMRR